MTTITIERAFLIKVLDQLDIAQSLLERSQHHAKMAAVYEELRTALAAPATAQAAEIERLKTESEERLQNCAALVAENEQLRKDAERYQWLAEYLVSDDESYDDAIVAATTVKEVDSVIDNAMKGTS